MENVNPKNENIERKYLNRMQENQFLKVKHSLLELKDRQLKDKEIKIRSEIERFFKQIIV